MTVRNFPDLHGSFISVIPNLDIANLGVSSREYCHNFVVIADAERLRGKFLFQRDE